MNLDAAVEQRRREDARAEKKAMLAISPKPETLFGQANPTPPRTCLALSWRPRSAIPGNRAFRARFLAKRFSRRGPALQSHNQRQEELTAELASQARHEIDALGSAFASRRVVAKYAENRLPPSLPSAYSAYSAVHLLTEESTPPANNLDGRTMPKPVEIKLPE